MSNQNENASTPTGSSRDNHASIDGNWVTLNHGDDLIEIYISNFFWRQAVYFNGKKVSQKSKFLGHKFSIDTKQYQLTFSYHNFRDGTCKLYGEGKLLDASEFSLYDDQTKRDFYWIVLLHSFFTLGITVFCLGTIMLLLNRL